MLDLNFMLVSVDSYIFPPINVLANVDVLVKKSTATKIFKKKNKQNVDISKNIANILKHFAQAKSKEEKKTLLFLRSECTNIITYLVYHQKNVESNILP